MLVDSHCHLFHCMAPETVQSYVEEQCGQLSYLVDISTNVKEFLNSYSYSLPDKVLRTVGLYPELAVDMNSSMLDEFEQAVSQHPPQAIGEVGMDYHWDYGGVKAQEPLFRHQIETAIRLNLPLIIHSRKAFEDTYRILSSYDLRIPVILHCYGYGPEEAEKFGFEGPYYFSFAGNVTYNSAKDLQETARIVPADRLLLETDSPYLSPVPKRGKKNFPHYVAHTYDFISNLKGVDIKTLAAQIERNFIDIFKLDV